MLNVYVAQGDGLVPIPGEDLAHAVWIDLYQPLPAQVERVATLGVEVPTLEDMEEIEISNRLYRHGEVDYMTAVLPGDLPDGTRVAMPVAFILTPERLVTVRHHAPRVFRTFPARADSSTMGCSSPERTFLGLTEEIIARLADILEGSGRLLDRTNNSVFTEGAGAAPKHLQQALQSVGIESEEMSRVRLGLLSVERMLAFFGATVAVRSQAGKLKPAVKAQLRDIQALEVHADFLSARVGMMIDSTLGMINLQQNNTVRILSVVAALFLPPTLIASIYGMNFRVMPELQWLWGYPMALGLMAGSALVSWLVMRWKKWM